MAKASVVDLPPSTSALKHTRRTFGLNIPSRITIPLQCFLKSPINHLCLFQGSWQQRQRRRRGGWEQPQCQGTARERLPGERSHDLCISCSWTCTPNASTLLQWTLRKQRTYMTLKWPHSPVCPGLFFGAIYFGAITWASPRHPFSSYCSFAQHSANIGQLR